MMGGVSVSALGLVSQATVVDRDAASADNLNEAESGPTDNLQSRPSTSLGNQSQVSSGTNLDTSEVKGAIDNLSEVPPLVPRIEVEDNSNDGLVLMQLGFDNDSDCDSIMPRRSKISSAHSTAPTDLLSICSGSTGASWSDTDDASTESGGAWNFVTDFDDDSASTPSTAPSDSSMSSGLVLVSSIKVVFLFAPDSCAHATHHNNAIGQDFAGSSGCHHWQEDCAC
ncbi:hypothetical protein ACHAWO_007440 [Cyclotella atomus]|uniref:Uncharacterized protein n=1 Tax=Cyclotella atomus TaxID=382360 RepID=A0ABD3PIA8_9STRA